MQSTKIPPISVHAQTCFPSILFLNEGWGYPKIGRSGGGGGWLQEPSSGATPDDKGRRQHSLCYICY